MQRRYGQAERNQKNTEQIWKENIAYCEGLQYLAVQQGVMVNTTGHAQDRIVDNRILDMVRRLHARLDQPAYVPSVEAITDDPQDHEAAKAGHALLRNFYHRRKMPREKRLALWWLIACGHFFAEPFYDATGGKKVTVPKLKRYPDEHPQAGEVMQEFNHATNQHEPAIEREAVIDPDSGQPVVDMVEQEDIDPITQQPITKLVPNPRMQPVMEEQPEGIVDFVHRSPFQVKRDPRTQEWRKVQWAFVDEIAPREQVLLRYSGSFRSKTGDELDAVLPKGEKVNTMPFMPQTSQLVSDMAGVPQPAPAAEDVVLLRRYYERPTLKFPNGRFLIYCPTGNLLLHEGDLDGDIPLFMIGYLIRPWILEGLSPVSQVRTLQRMLNYITGRWWMHLRAWAGGWPIIPITSGISRDNWSNDIGSGLFYNPAGGKPEFLNPPFGNLAGIQVVPRPRRAEHGGTSRASAIAPRAGSEGGEGIQDGRTPHGASRYHSSPGARGYRGRIRGLLSCLCLDLARRHYETDRMVAISGG